VVEYLGFKESGGDSDKFCGVNPKYSTTAGFGGIFLRDRLEELPIASSGEHQSYGRAQFIPDI
jgi:hypothetical protein